MSEPFLAEIIMFSDNNAFQISVKSSGGSQECNGGIVDLSDRYAGKYKGEYAEDSTSGRGYIKLNDEDIRITDENTMGVAVNIVPNYIRCDDERETIKGSVETMDAILSMLKDENGNVRSMDVEVKAKQNSAENIGLIGDTQPFILSESTIHGGLALIIGLLILNLLCFVCVKKKFKPKKNKYSKVELIASEDDMENLKDLQIE